MPTEPRKKMGDVLKEYARMRRQQAEPLELSEAVRAMLQAQVARTYREAHEGERPERSFLFAQWWQRLLLGGSAVALLLVGAGIWWQIDLREKQASAQEERLNFFKQNVREEQLLAQADSANDIVAGEPFEPSEPDSAKERFFAKATGAERLAENDGAVAEPSSMELNETESRQVNLAFSTQPARQELPADMFSNAPRLSLGITPPPPAARPESLARDRGAVPRPEASARETESLGAFRVAAGSLSTSTSTAASEVTQQRKELVEQMVDLKNATALKSVAARAEAAPSSEPPNPGAPSLYFEQVDFGYRANRNSPPQPVVLRSFQMERQGDTLRIVGEDGSIYEGRAQVLPVTLGRSAVGAAASLGDAQSGQHGFSFQASGTNRTLQQIVLFSGEFSPATNLASVAQSTRGRGFGGGGIERGTQVSPGQQFPQQKESKLRQTLLQGRIQGTAAVGSTQRFRVEAQQVGP